MPCCRPPRSCSTEGFHATSLDDIAARLSVSKPTLYYYVKNKDEILLQCVRRRLEMTLRRYRASRARRVAMRWTSCVPACRRIPTSSCSLLACA